MIYKYKATLPGSKVFMREYEIKGETTLYALHEFLLNDLDFAPDQMVLFRGLDAGEKVRSEYGLFDMGDGTMDTVSIEKTLRREEEYLEYVYDMHKDKYIRLSYLGECEPAPRASYPRLTAEKGRNPDQFADTYDDFDQFAEPLEESNDNLFMEEELPEGGGME